MEIIVGNKKTVLNEKRVKEMSFEEFEKMCLSLPTFKDLVPKERKKKIKTVYNAIVPKTQKYKKSESKRNLSGYNRGGKGNDSEPKQKPASRGEDKRESEDNA